MEIKRDRYLNLLISMRENGSIKIITGLRRCGKSYLIFELYRNYLLQHGVKENCIIEIKLEELQYAEYRNPFNLDKYIREKISDKAKQYYLFLDEIQKVREVPNPYLPNTEETIGFVDVLLGLKSESNLDIYVTGSNSRMLSSDIRTEFRDRGVEIRLNPLTYNEFYAAYPGEKRYAWREFVRFGGMPEALTKKHTEEQKSQYLKDLLEKTYIADIVERHDIRNDVTLLDDLLNITASSVGSLTNPTKISDTFQSVNHVAIKSSTVSTYLSYFIDAFLVRKAERYDIKGRKYIGTQQKYYFADQGLRNARLNFRQVEENHIMENIIYNELNSRGFNVDVGVVEFLRKKDGQQERVRLEIDFVVNKSDKTYYIQSALSVADSKKREQETASLNRISDSFQKIVVVRDDIVPTHDEKGIYYISVEDFLLDYIETL